MPAWWNQYGAVCVFMVLTAALSPAVGAIFKTWYKQQKRLSRLETQESRRHAYYMTAFQRICDHHADKCSVIQMPEPAEPLTLPEVE
jgi:hypothetical protein